MNNKKKIQEKYRRNKGIGIEYPCQYCGKFSKRTNFNHFCSDKCRFLSKIEKNKNECWEWTGKILQKWGYGELSIKHKSIRAHRYSYELFKGKIPKGKIVCHTCDNRKCVNPDHLWIGTHKENHIDMVNKKRQVIAKGWHHTEKTKEKFKLRHRPGKKGEKSHLAKLTQEKVNKIKFLHNKGITQKEIAKIFKCDPSTISLIVNNKRWNI